LAPVLAQRKDEIQWAGRCVELVKKKAEERIVVVGKWRIYLLTLSKTVKVRTNQPQGRE